MSQILDGPILTSQHVQEALAQKINTSGLSNRKLAERSGISKSRINLLANSQAQVTAEDLQRLGHALSFSPGDLFEPRTKFEMNAGPTQVHLSRVVTSIFEASFAMTRELGQSAGITEVLRWHESTGGRLENYEQLKPFIGLYHVETNTSPRIEAVEMGAHCLASASLHVHGADGVNRFIRSIGSAPREEIMLSYAAVKQSETYQLFKRRVLVDFPGAGPQYWLNYATLLLPVETPSRDSFVMNFSVYVSSELVGENSGQSKKASGSSAS